MANVVLPPWAKSVGNPLADLGVKPTALKAATPPKAPAKGQGPASGTLTSFKGNPSQPVKRYAPAYKGEKPAGFETIPQGPQNSTGRAVRPFYQTPVDKRSGLERAVDRQVTPLLAKGSKVASPAVTIPATVAGDVLANLGGGPSVLAAAHAIQHHNAVQAGIELAGILPVGRFGRAVKGAEEGVRAAEDATQAAKGVYRGSRSAEIEQLIHEIPTPTGRPPGHVPLASQRTAPPHVWKVQHDAVTGTTNYTPESLKEMSAAAPKGQYLYHATSDTSLPSIRRTGLRPGKERKGEITGVYFAQDGIGVRTLRPSNSRAGDVLLRVKRGNVNTEVTDIFEKGSGLEEHVSRSPVPASSIEYLGHDGEWHPRSGGGGNGKFPPTKNGATPPSGPANPGDVVKALKGAGKIRNQQNALYSAERTKRITAAEQIMNEVGGEEGHHLAMKALSGELPKLPFTGGKDLNREHVPALFQHIQDHPDLRPFERVRARKALLKVFDGVTPQHNEIKLLTKVFGPEATKLVKSVGFGKKLANTAGELVNVPRAVMSSFDLSAPFRQGLVAGTTHPVLFARNFKPMLKAFKSEGAYQGIMDDIVSRPNFDRYQKGGLGITDLESGLTHREEQWFGENLAEKIPVAGHGIRASGRAYVGFLNKTRADVFDSLLSDAEKAGRDINDEKMLKDIAKAVNSATGRGSGPKAIQSWLPALNTIFFSPRLLFSRLDYLNPVNYTRLDPIARQEYLKGSLSLLGTVGTVLTLAKLAGAEVNTNPLSADFAKIKYGNTRVDILGGFQQPVRLLAQLASGKITSSTTGKTLTLGPEGPGHLSRFDIGLRFAQSKLAPVPSFVTDVSKGTQFGGQKLDWGFNHNNPVFQRMIPLLAQDARDIYSNKGPGPHGLGAAVGAYGLGALGIGLQTYGPKQTKGPTIVPFPGYSGVSSNPGSVSTQPNGVTLPPWAR